VRLSSASTLQITLTEGSSAIFSYIQLLHSNNKTFVDFRFPPQIR